MLKFSQRVDQEGLLQIRFSIRILFVIQEHFLTLIYNLDQ